MIKNKSSGRSLLNRIERFFKIQDRSSTFKKEFLGALSTFIAMGYILAVNPGILSGADGGAAGQYAGVFFLGTAIAAFAGTLLMGLIANVPVALAPGMGINAFLAFTVASPYGMGLSIENALVATMFSGILYVIIAVTPLRNYVIKALPKNIKLAIGAMIGLFLAYIGLSNAGIIVSGAFTIPFVESDGTFNGMYQTVSTNTVLGDFSNPIVIIGILSLLILLVLFYFKVKGSILISMILGIVMLSIAGASGVTEAKNAFALQEYNEFGKFGELSRGMWTSVGKTLASPKAYIVILVCLYTDFFETTGTLVTIARQAELPMEGKEGEDWLMKANIVDASSTIIGATMMTSTTTSYIESSVGVSSGSRTGLTSVFVALFFAIAIAAWPIMGPLMPVANTSAVDHAVGALYPVTGGALVLVGILMTTQLKFFEWNKTLDIPVLVITVLFGVLGYSIAAGMASGIIVFYTLNLFGFVKEAITNRGSSIENESIKPTDDVDGGDTPNFKRQST